MLQHQFISSKTGMTESLLWLYVSNREDEKETFETIKHTVIPKDLFLLTFKILYVGPS